MNYLVKTISSKIANGYRLIKAQVLGKDDVQEVDQVLPYGIDSNPVKDMVALYSQTSVGGESVIIGYMNKSQIADAGEIRFFSTNGQGDVKFYTWLKNDGTCEFGGTSDNLVRYKPLHDVIANIQDFLNQQLPLIASGVSAGGGSYTPGSAQFDVTGAKIDEIKTL